MPGQWVARQERPAEPVLLRQLLERRARVGDRDEPRSVGDLRPEVGEMGERLRGRPL